MTEKGIMFLRKDNIAETEKSVAEKGWNPVRCGSLGFRQHPNHTGNKKARWGGMGTEVMSPPLSPQAVRKTVHRVISSGQLSLALSSYSTRESRPCTSPGQHSRADPVVTRAGELTLPAANYRTWESRPCTLLAQFSSASPGRGGTSEAVLRTE